MSMHKISLILLLTAFGNLSIGCGRGKKAEPEAKEKEANVQSVAGGAIEITFPGRVHRNKPKLYGTSVIKENVNCSWFLSYTVKATTNFAYVKAPKTAEERKARFLLWVKNNYRMGGTYRFYSEKSISQGEFEGIEMFGERQIDAEERFYAFRIYQYLAETHETTIVISVHGTEAEVASEDAREFLDSVKLNKQAFDGIDQHYASFKPKRSGKTWATNNATRFDYETFNEPTMIEKFDFTFVVQKDWSRKLKVKNEDVLENASELRSPKGKRVYLAAWLPGKGPYKTKLDYIDASKKMYKGKSDFKYDVTQREVGNYKLTKVHFRRSEIHNHEVCHYYAIRDDWPGVITVDLSGAKETLEELEPVLLEMIRSARPIK